MLGRCALSVSDTTHRPVPFSYLRSWHWLERLGLSCGGRTIPATGLQAQYSNWILGLTFFPVIDSLRVAPSPLGVSQRAPPDPLPAGLTVSEWFARTTH